MKIKSILFTRSIILAITLLLSSQVLLSQSPVDTAFNAFPSIDSTDTSQSTTVQMILQPDGKIITTFDFSFFSVMNGEPINKVVRINTDGTIDDTFNCIECNSISEPTILLQGDGKIVVAGRRTPPQSANRADSKLIRVNSDGSLDNSFSTPYLDKDNFRYVAVVFEKQSDGKLFVGRKFSFPDGSQIIRVNRLNTDGSFDTGFQQFTTTIFSGAGRGSVHGLTQLPDGKIYVYGDTNFGPFARLNADGTADTTYTKPTFTALSQFRPNVSEIQVNPDGKVIIAGFFITVNGLSRENLTRLNSDGSVDTTFADPSIIYSPPLDRFSDGWIMINGRINFFDANGLPKKLTSDGSPTGTLNLPKDLTKVSNFVIDQNTDKIYIFGIFDNDEGSVFKYARLNADGSLDPTFNNSVGNAAIISAIAVQSDQKIIMVGIFDSVNGISQKNIARVNPDGTLDETFNVSTEVRQLPRKVIADPNGQIYLVATINFGRKLVRLNLDGSLDPSFDVGIDNGSTLALQSDGKILVNEVTSVKRFNTDGTFDTNFQPDLGTSPRINDVLVQANGQIVIAGSATFEGTANRRLGRYNADGSYDPTLATNLDSTVKDVAQLPNGRYLVSTDKLQRLNNSGIIDNTYISPVFDYYTSQSSEQLKFRLLSDQSVIAYGNFSNVNGNPSQFGLTRVLSDGTLSDATYPNGTNGVVLDIEFQDDGKMLVGGNFGVIEKISRPGIARLELPALTQVVDYDFDGDGKADIAVFRPSENKWYVLRSSDFGVTQQIFAITGDIPAPGDFDGDGKTDYSIFRNSVGDWWSLSSSAGNQIFAHLGQNGDIPRPSDFDGDGRADYIVYRPTDFTWYRVSSATGQPSDKRFGTTGDKPLIADFDGDGKSDVTIYRPSTGTWWWQSSIDDDQRAIQWGISTDIPSPGDYDGDGKTEFAIYRPSTGVWWIYNRFSQQSTIIQFGIAEDIPVPADYDGDGKTDIAVFRPSTGIWYLLQSRDGFAAYQFGISTDIPVPNALIP